MLSVFDTQYYLVVEQIGLPASPDAIRPFIALLAQRCREVEMVQEDVVMWLLTRQPFAHRERTVRAVVAAQYHDPAREDDEPYTTPLQETQVRLRNHLEQRYEFRHNAIRGDVEYRRRTAYDVSFRSVGQRQINTIIQGALEEGIPAFDRDVARYLNSEAVALYHPLQAYLASLPAWDKKDHIGRLAETIPTLHKGWHDGFRRWFLSLVAHWQHGTKQYANAIVPLLIGGQGCGKSTFCARLIPPQLTDYYVDDIDVKNKKQAEIALTRFGLINLDEFDAISATYQPFLKHILQKPKVALRMPFEKTTLTLPRIASFIATSNNYDLLSDPTGSRRFLCIEINGTIRLDKPIRHAQLFAQAVEALKQGERYWFTPKEEAALIAENRPYQQQSPEELLLLDYFRPPRPDEEEGEWLSPTEILLRIQSHSGIKLSQRSIRSFGRILRRHEFPQRRISAGIRYRIVEKEKGKSEE